MNSLVAGGLIVFICILFSYAKREAQLTVLFILQLLIIGLLLAE